MKYVISGGGTGGHIYPALAIISEIRRRDKDAEILYVGRKNSLEEKLAKKDNVRFESIDIKGLPRRKINKDTFVTFFTLLKGLRECNKIIKDFKPDVAIGTGGYVCAPVIMKAQQMGILSVVQEQNAYPGKTNRLLSRKVDLLALNFEEAKKYLSTKRIIVTGNPIRSDFNHIDREKARKELGIKDDEKFVLSFGGSGGQESTNEAIINILKSDYDIDFRLYHITGNDHYDGFMKEISDLEIADNIKILNYSNEIPKLLMASDLVIASSSAMTLAEISAVGLASILIPKAYTAGNHQVYNAKSYRDKNACRIIYEEDLDAKTLFNNIKDLLDNDKVRQEMAENSKLLASRDAVEKLVDEIELLVNEREK